MCIEFCCHDTIHDDNKNNNIENNNRNKISPLYSLSSEVLRPETQIPLNEFQFQNFADDPHQTESIHHSARRSEEVYFI